MLVAGMLSCKVDDTDYVDRTPPSPVTGLTLGYSSASKTLTANWHNPTDSDFAGLVLSWKKEGGTATEVPLSKEAESYAITNIDADGSKYIVSVKAKDDAGNESAATETSMTLDVLAAAEITGVSLSRTHLDSEETDRNITVTVTGNNFDALTSLLVQVTDGSSSPVSASIDKAHNKASATVIAPVPSSPSDAGKTYTVKVIVNGSPVAQTATFKVTTPARVSAIQLSKNPIKFGTQPKVGVTVTGTNLDIRGETKINLLDSNGSEVSASTVTVAETEGTETEFSKELTLPGEIGYYTVAVFFKGKRQYTTTLQLYGEPVIESVFIPKAGTPYGGNKLPVKITGKNFKASDVTAGDFSWSGVTFSNFKIESDTLTTAEVECPYVAGDKTVTVMCKTASKSGVLSVKDYSAYTVGKIVLADKSLVEKDSYTAIDTSNPPVGIICGFAYGVPKMIALHSSDSGLSWAKNGSTGYNTKFEGIICTLTGSQAVLTATFTGDTDGSDNWSYIKSKDAEGTADAVVAENYPAFNWVSQYNTKYADKLNNKKFDWYMPSIAELCEVYKNRTAIDASLSKIHGLENGSGYADAKLVNSYYWSSSQYSNYRSAWVVDFSVGYVSSAYKDNNIRVCCLAGF